MSFSEKKPLSDRILSLPSDVSEPLYPVPNFEDDPLTNPGSWQFVKKSDVSFDLDADLGGGDEYNH